MSVLHMEAASSPNWDARGEAPIDMLVLHYTGMADGAAALRRLRDPAPTRGAYAAALPPAHAAGPPDEPLGRVSAHYLVETDGRVFQLVDEAHRAWHAGVAFWDGTSDVNARSIGIEIVNGGHDFPGPDGRPPPYPDVQVEAVAALVTAACARHPIPPWRVVGHSDVAPGRKTDPGERFPWLALDRRDLALSAGRWLGAPDHTVRLRAGEAGAAVRRLQRRLQALGYGLAESGGYDERTQYVASAFQRRFAASPADPLEGRVWTAANDAILAAAFQRAAVLAASRPQGDAHDVPRDPDPSPPAANA